MKFGEGQKSGGLPEMPFVRGSDGIGLCRGVEGVGGAWLAMAHAPSRPGGAAQAAGSL